MSEGATPRRCTVAVIGDAHLTPNSPKYALGCECGTLLVDRGFRLVTGGMGGVMEAASRGALESSAWSPGSSIALLPGSDPEAANPWVDVVLPTGLDHLRNAVVAQSDAVIAIGGGAGTLSEMAFAWIHCRLLVALRVDGWSGQLADQRIDERRRYPAMDDDQVFGANDASEAVEIVAARVERYVRRHSSIR